MAKSKILTIIIYTFVDRSCLTISINYIIKCFLIFRSWITYRSLMMVGVLLLAGLFVLPLWSITLKAPQYPIPLGMKIFIDKFADLHPNDIQNINLMNHYVGMKFIPKTIPEFRYFPIVAIFMILAGVLIAFKGSHRWYLIWLITVAVLGAVGIYDFYLWEYDYGHDLSPKAILKFTNPDGSIMGFQPPLFGGKTILNFKVHSYPGIGAYVMLTGMILAYIAYRFKKNDNHFTNLKKRNP